jgi:hypothetical protein
MTIFDGIFFDNFYPYHEKFRKIIFFQGMNCDIKLIKGLREGIMPKLILSKTKKLWNCELYWQIKNWAMSRNLYNLWFYNIFPIIGFSEYSADYSDFTDYRDHEYSVFTDYSKFYFFLKPYRFYRLYPGKNPVFRFRFRFMLFSHLTRGGVR